jgi:predicted site-specific integrase-resolvase
MKRAQDEWYFQSEPLGQRERPITTRELANHLRVTTRCLANWRKQGLIPYWRLTARALRYELSAVERALSKPNFEEE